MMLLARRLRETNDALAATTFMSLSGRVARALLSLVEAFGNPVGGGRIVVRQKITQSDLAGMAGIARENVSRILTDWTRRSIVSRLRLPLHREQEGARARGRGLAHARARPLTRVEAHRGEASIAANPSVSRDQLLRTRRSPPCAARCAARPGRRCGRAPGARSAAA